MKFKFEKEDFTEDEYKILLLMIRLAHTTIETQRIDNYDIIDSNALWSLKTKLGIENFE